MPTPLSELKAQRKPIVNINAVHAETLTPLDRVSVIVTDKVGTPGFFLLIFAWTTTWLGWNLLAPKQYQFDPPSAFVFWLFISNMIQILLMPLIMVGQNIQSKHAEMRAEQDYQLDLKAEQDIEIILEHLERIEERLANIP